MPECLRSGNSSENAEKDRGIAYSGGSYDELIAKNGFFAELVERQRVDVWQSRNYKEEKQ